MSLDRHNPKGYDKCQLGRSHPTASVGMHPARLERAMWTRNRRLTAVVAAGYVLALAAAALVHDHAGHDGGCCGGQCGTHALAGNHQPGGSHGGHQDGQPARRSRRHPTQDSNCSVCQFLAQKPALRRPSRRYSAALVQEVAALRAGMRRRRRLLGLAQPRPARFRVNFSPLV